MPKIPRGEKLNMLLRDELGKIIDRDIEFAEGTLVTITRVVTSSDIRYATVMLSVLNGSDSNVLELLAKNIYSIQQRLNRVLRMRPVPKIRFAIDEEELRRESVEQSLATIRQKGEI